jgi:hypothetical protein
MGYERCIVMWRIPLRHLDYTVHRKLCIFAQFFVHVTFRSKILMVTRAGEDVMIQRLRYLKFIILVIVFLILHSF